MINPLRRYFSRTPEGALLRRFSLPFLGIFVFIGIVLITAPPVWEYTNSTTFCGETCHTMPPEYQTYLISPHARVPCVDCHIGRGLIIQQAYRKTGHMRLIYQTITGSYEYPIHVSSMRPARDTCELCHFPEKFSDDSLRSITHFEPNETNDPYDLYLLMHTGGGSAREGLGRGIHWHVENSVEFIATDDRQQDIPWVRSHNADGTTIDYVAEDAAIDVNNLDQYDIVEMDCITCHNRISHLIETPDRVIDNALGRGDLPADMPNIRAVAVEPLRETYESSEEAHASINAIEDYYRDTYPDYYAENFQIVQDAVATITLLWAEKNYPEQELSWNTHPNNIGHEDWPGCFRCHDGEHISTEGDAIRLECNLCHSIPQVVRPDDIEPMMPLTTGNEPESHLDSTWISRHHNEFDRTCSNCHTVENPGGTSDTSFCSNSACHGQGWEFAGFDAPALALAMGLSQDAPAAEIIAEGNLTYQSFWPLLMISCGRCHDSTPILGLKVTDYESLMAGSESGPVIIPGDPAESRLVEVLEGDHFSHFTQDQLALLREWIAAGAVEGDSTPQGPASYETLQPVLTTACGSCHGGPDAERELDVTTYESLMVGSRGGLVVEAGFPEDSLIMIVLNEGHFAELTEGEMALLHDWITIGMPQTNAEAIARAGMLEPAIPAYSTIQAIFEQNCIECHGGDEPAADLDLSSYGTLMAGSRYGPVVAPGDLQNSYLLQILQEEHPGERSAAQYRLIRSWIAAGALNE